MANVRKDNTSGCTGICWCKNEGKWSVGIRLSGKQVHLGYFTNVEEASKTYQTARNLEAKKTLTTLFFQYTQIYSNEDILKEPNTYN